MTRKSKVVIIIALMLGMALTALDVTIVGTAMPSIVGKLGGISLYSWVFSIYLLTSTTTVPIYGKLADLYGRKPIFIVGSSIFLIGSIACGSAQSMEQLIVFRAIQGLGAGAVMPIVLTIIGDIFSLEERAKVQGFFSSVWGVSSILGPALGGVLVDSFDWRWVFYINIPFGLISMLLLIIYLKETQIEKKKHQLDYMGAAVLTAGIGLLLYAVLQGGVAWEWTSFASISLFVLAALLLLAFIQIERRAAEPILPLSLFQNRIITISSLGGVVVGTAMFSIGSYVPLFVQGVKGGTATTAGMALAPQLIAWPIAATVSGKIIIRYGYRFTAVIGLLLCTVGLGMLVFLNPQTDLIFVMVAMAMNGTGMGLASNALVLAVQNAVPWNLRGVSTASHQFFRTIGGTIGVAVMGAILNTQMAQHIAPILPRFAQVAQRLPKDIANVLLEPTVRATLPLEFLTQLQAALAYSLFWVYILMFVLGVLGLFVVFYLPGGPAEKHAYKEPAQAKEEPVPGPETPAPIG